MAIAFVAATTASTATYDPSLTLSVVVSSGSNLLLFVAVNQRGGTANDPTGITYGGTALTMVSSSSVKAGGNPSWGSFWTLIAPTVGTANLVVTTPSGGAKLVVVATTYTGVDQTTPVGTPATTTGSGASQSATVSSATGEVVIGALIHADGSTIAVTDGGSQTRRALVDTGSGGGDCDIEVSEKAGASSTVVSWTTSPAIAWGTTGVALKPAATSTYPVPESPVLQYVMQNPTIRM